jgi:Fe2+ transport system protein FeoA
MLNFHQLPLGARARLSRLGGDGPFRQRLMEMGFLPGTSVRVVRRIAVGGLVELEVRGGHVSLRDSEAEALRFERDA